MTATTLIDPATTSDALTTTTDTANASTAAATGATTAKNTAATASATTAETTTASTTTATASTAATATATASTTTASASTSADAPGAPDATALVAKAYEEVIAAADTPEMFAAPDSIILDYYGIPSSDYTAAIFMMSVDSLLADEIVIAYAVDPDAAEAINQRLENRLKVKADEARSYSPEQYAVIESCTVTRDGNWVAMLVSPGAEQMRAAFIAAIE